MAIDPNTKADEWLAKPQELRKDIGATKPFFTKSRTPHPPVDLMFKGGTASAAGNPPTFTVQDIQRFLNELASESGEHPSRASQTQELGPKRTAGGSKLTVVAPDSYGEYEVALAKLRQSFEDAEGRQPTAEDDHFWSATSQVLRAFLGDSVGD